MCCAEYLVPEAIKLDTHHIVPPSPSDVSSVILVPRVEDPTCGAAAGG